MSTVLLENGLAKVSAPISSDSKSLLRVKNNKYPESWYTVQSRGWLLYNGCKNCDELSIRLRIELLYLNLFTLLHVL